MPRTPQERQIGGVSARPADIQVRFRDLLSRLAEKPRDAHDVEPRVGPFLTISRQAGSGGVEVARQVGMRFGWAVYDRELVDTLARRLELEPDILELMDETRSNWFNDTLLNLLNSRLVLQDAYVGMLGRVMLLAACEGRVVIVGRAGHLLLPGSSGLRVRVLAPLADRVERIRSREKIAADEAVRRVERLDSGRADFIRRHFHREIEDPSQYDMVVDTVAFGLAGAAELVGRALQLKGLVGPT